MIGPIDARFAYIIIAIPFALLWAVLYAWSPKTRGEQFHISIIFAFLGVIADSLMYFNDFWRPESIALLRIGFLCIYPESMLFGAAFAGVAAVLYQAVSKQGTSKAYPEEKKWQRRFLALGVFVAVAIPCLSLHLNSIYATAIGALAVAALIIYIRPDLLKPALASGALTACAMFCSYFILVHGIANSEEWFRRIWLLYNSPLGTRILGVPLTELVWGFSTGAAIGVFHKFTHGLRFTPMPASHDTTGQAK